MNKKEIEVSEEVAKKAGQTAKEKLGKYIGKKLDKTQQFELRRKINAITMSTIEEMYVDKSVEKEKKQILEGMLKKYEEEKEKLDQEFRKRKGLREISTD